MKDFISVMGLSMTQFAALLGAGYSVGDMGDCDGLYCQRTSFRGRSSQASSLTNKFFIDLLNNSWEQVSIGESRQMFQVKLLKISFFKLS